ncbi:MAG: glycine zipper 2TM domain-containing protein [Gallionella sp.]|nr:glycine zipper 2TM domain-containing protein [Gallionella sp.]
MFNIVRVGMLLSVAMILGGCASSLSGGGYSRDQARQVQDVRMATVESVRRVQIEGTRSPVGTIAGAVVGGIAGSNVGGGRGSTVGAVLGSVLGGVAGSAIEEGTTRQGGLEITVRFDDGRMIAVTQGSDEKFVPGERVRVLTGGSATRISH